MSAALTTLLCQRDEAVQFGAEKDRVGRRLLASFQPEQGARHGPAPVDLADDVVGRCRRPGEEHLVELALPGEGADRADLDAGLAHVDEQERDAGVLAHVSVGAGEQEHPVRLAGPGRPHLLAVDHPLLAVEHGASGQRGEVAPGPRFGEALAPAVVTTEDPRQEPPLLRLGAPPQQRAAEHLDTERVVVSHGRDAGTGELLHQHDLLAPAEPGSAVLRRPRDPQQPVGRQRGTPLLDETVGFAPVGDRAEARPVRR